MEQQLILVDKKNKPSGKYAPKTACHSGKGLPHLAFTVLILNHKNEVLLQDRKHLLWNHFWDLTNSHPLHLQNGENETLDQSVSRCLKKEWGVDFPVKKLFSFRYFAQYENNFCEKEYCVFFLGRFDGEVRPSGEVAYGYKWLDLAEFKKEIKVHPELYTPWLLRGIKKLEKQKLL